MSDAGFVIAAYGVILGGLAGYTALLLWRISRIRSHDRPPGDDGG